MVSLVSNVSRTDFAALGTDVSAVSSSLLSNTNQPNNREEKATIVEGRQGLRVDW